MSTGIEWTDETWNPITGCTKVSPGCAHCYAETVADRFWATQYPPMCETVTERDAAGYPVPVRSPRPRRFTDVQCHEDRLDQPLHWKRPRKVFVNSMSDLFHESVPDAFIDRVFVVMALAPRHTFQVLTKRAERMRSYCADDATTGRLVRLVAELTDGIDGVTSTYTNKADGKLGFNLPNVWLGVSIENKKTRDQRVPELLQTPAAVKFLSCEPLLEDIASNEVFSTYFYSGGPDETDRIDWVIVGGESGAGARPFDMDWARSIVHQCRVAGVACFVKQLGATPIWNGCGLVANNPKGRMVKDVIGGREVWLLRPSDHKGGDWSEWPEDLRVREFPE